MLFGFAAEKQHLFTGEHGELLKTGDSFGEKPCVYSWYRVALSSVQLAARLRLEDMILFVNFGWPGWLKIGEIK